MLINLMKTKFKEYQKVKSMIIGDYIVENPISGGIGNSEQRKE